METRYVLTRTIRREIFGKTFIFNNTPKTINDWQEYFQEVIDVAHNSSAGYKKIIVSHAKTMESKKGRKRASFVFTNVHTHNTMTILLYEEKSLIDARHLYNIDA